MLWAVTAYFNPQGFTSRLRNFHEFRERLGAPLVAVELAFDKEFELREDDAELLIQLRGNDVMWQKERLLNVAIAALPPECDKVAWLDSDVIFQNENWAQETSDLLEEFPLVQPFSELCDLKPGLVPSPELNGNAGEYCVSLGSMLSQGWTQRDIVRKHHAGIRSADNDHRFVGTGLAWAGRRALVQELGLYDACIVGGGDEPITCAARGALDVVEETGELTGPHWEHYLRWARRWHAAIDGRIGCTPGLLYHLWHGQLSQRGYVTRHQDFRPFEFDPRVDIALDHTGCWRWNTEKPEMHAYVRNYFATRCEDG